MNLKINKYYFALVISFFFQTNLLISSDLDQDILSKLDALESKLEVFDKSSLNSLKVKSDKCRTVSKSSDIYTLKYKGNCNNKVLDTYDFYKGTLTSGPQGSEFETGVLVKKPNVSGVSFKNIFVGNKEIGYVVAGKDYECLNIFGPEGNVKDKLEFSYSVLNCSQERDGKNIRFYSREIENNNWKSNYYIDVVADNLQKLNAGDISRLSDFDKYKKMATNFVYSANLVKKIPKQVFFNGEIFSESTYQTFRANLDNFVESNSLEINDLNLYASLTQGSSQTVTSDEVSDEEDFFSIVFAVLIIGGFIAYRIRKRRNTELQVRLAAEQKAEKARLAAEKKAEKARLAAEQKAEKARLAAEKKLKDEEQRKQESIDLKKSIDEDLIQFDKELSEELTKNVKEFEDLYEIILQEEEDLKNLAKKHPAIGEVVKSRELGDSSSKIVGQIKKEIDNLKS